MAKHTITLKVEHEIPVGNKDVQVAVKVDDAALGRVKISQGGIDWLPSPNSRSSFALTWSQFAAVMAREGRAK